MEKRGVISPGLTPPEHDDTATRKKQTAAVNEKRAVKELDAIRELDGDFRKLAADRAKKAL